MPDNIDNKYIRSLQNVKMSDIDIVGGKNASLGELLNGLSDAGIRVPGGFATTADAYREFLATDDLDQRIDQLLQKLDTDDVESLTIAGRTIRDWIMQTPFSAGFTHAISQAYEALIVEYGHEVSWAVRSSATAEDMPDASFAGQQETYLNVRGYAQVVASIHKVFASLYNDRAISYRVHKGYKHVDVALSAGIQKMVRSDLASSGVMFTLDTESGFRDAVLITSSYGLGEMVVQGAVNPDEFYVYKKALNQGRPAILKKNLGDKSVKMTYASSGAETVETIPVEDADRSCFSLNDDEIHELARIAVIIENHYQHPVDIEWAKDGHDQRLYVVQARPETIQSQKQTHSLERFSLKQRGDVLITGRAIGTRIGQGRARVVASLDEMGIIQPGDVLVTDMTDPDWEPVMKKASAIVTNRGGRTCHAAIIARELGVPAVVGCNSASQLIHDGMDVTVSCAEGDTGYVYAGLLPFEVSNTDFDAMPELPVKIMMNVGNPQRAFDFASLPNAGVGLARLEFIINNMVGIHPRALLEPEKISSQERELVQDMVSAYADPVEFYVRRISEGVATIAAAFSPAQVIVRLSDFKSNEYANLVGGRHFEPDEENPMLGFRGASRYLSEEFKPCFDLECQALRHVREEMGLENLSIMVPFVRTLEQARLVTEALAANGLARGVNGLRLIMMCELPSNVILAEQYLEYFDGFSIGSNDLTQLVLGLDRDSALVSKYFDERDPAITWMLHRVISVCKKAGKYIGICGQGPSDYPELALWLMQEGISSISLNPDSIVATWLHMSEYAHENNQAKSGLITPG